MLFKKDYSKITEYDREKNNKKNNYTRLNKKFALCNQTVLLGDSITDFFNWYELFYDFSAKSGQAVYNRGISGDTTDRLLDRLEENVLCIKPKNLVLLIGTNDIGRGLPLEMTLCNVESIINNSKKACPGINFIFQAVYPINENMRDRHEKRNNNKIKELNREYRNLCEKYGCIWLDLTDKLSDDDGMLKREFTYDGLHVNAGAYEIIAESIIKYLK